MRRYLLFPLFYLLTALAAQAQLTTAQWKSDMDLLEKELAQNNPRFRSVYPEEAWRSNINQLLTGITQKDPLRAGLELQAILARAPELKARVELTQLLQTNNRVIPVGMGWYKDGLYVSGTVKLFEKTLGKRIVAINDIPSEEALQKLQFFIGAENPYGLRRDGPLWLRFAVAFRLAGVSQSDTLVLTFENGEKQAIYPPNFRTLKRDDMMPAQFRAEKPDLRWQPISLGMTQRNAWLEKEKVFFLQYIYGLSAEMAAAAGDTAMAAQLPPFQPVVDSLLAILDSIPDARFFLDLRFNQGGNPADCIALAERIGKNKSINKKDRIFIAINSYTPAAGVLIVNAFREHTRAVVLGEPTGDRPIHTGDEVALRLPNCGLKVTFAADYLPENPRIKDALYPDVMIELPFSDFAQGKDPVLDRVRGWKNSEDGIRSSE